jgi:hypothetical protein
MKSILSTPGMSCRDNPNVPCLCLLSSTSGEYGTRIRTHHPTRTGYSDCLDKHLAGRQFHTKCRGTLTAQTPHICGNKCCGSGYIDVHGRKRQIDFNYPYALVIYTPRPLERYFQTKERAVIEAPRCGDWQIIHLPTGQIIYEPKRKGC